MYKSMEQEIWKQISCFLYRQICEISLSGHKGTGTKSLFAIICWYNIRKYVTIMAAEKGGGRNDDRNIRRNV